MAPSEKVAPLNPLLATTRSYNVPDGGAVRVTLLNPAATVKLPEVMIVTPAPVTVPPPPPTPNPTLPAMVYVPAPIVALPARLKAPLKSCAGAALKVNILPPEVEILPTVWNVPLLMLPKVRVLPL